MPNFYEIQETIADNLGIKRQDCSIESLFNCLSEEPKFIVYSTDDNNPSENLLMWGILLNMVFINCKNEIYEQ